jgi:hypothetical protein
LNFAFFAAFEDEFRVAGIGTEMRVEAPGRCGSDEIGIEAAGWSGGPGSMGGIFPRIGETGKALGG